MPPPALKSRSPGWFTHRGVNAGSCSGEHERWNVFTVAVCTRGRLGGARRFGAHRGRKGMGVYSGGRPPTACILLFTSGLLPLSYSSTSYLGVYAVLVYLLLHFILFHIGWNDINLATTDCRIRKKIVNSSKLCCAVLRYYCAISCTFISLVTINRPIIPPTMPVLAGLLKRLLTNLVEVCSLVSALLQLCLFTVTVSSVLCVLTYFGCYWFGTVSDN